MIDEFIYIILILVAMVFEATLFWAGNEIRKMDVKFCAFLLFSVAVLSSAAFGYVFIKGLLR